MVADIPGLVQPTGTTSLHHEGVTLVVKASLRPQQKNINLNEHVSFLTLHLDTVNRDCPLTVLHVAVTVRWSIVNPFHKKSYTKNIS